MLPSMYMGCVTMCYDHLAWRRAADRQPEESEGDAEEEEWSPDFLNDDVSDGIELVTDGGDE